MFGGDVYFEVYLNVLMNLFVFFRCNTLSPKSEIAIVAVTTQMVVSFLFLAVILALGVSLVNSERSKNRKSMEVGGAGVGGVRVEGFEVLVEG